MRKLATGLVTLLISGGIAVAQGNNQKVAEDEFMKGNTAYNLGRFDEAVDHFTKAYEAWPQAEFLYNIAQSYRLAGNCKQATYFYKRFRSLKEKDTAAPLSPKKKEEVDKFIAELADCAAKADTATAVQPQTLDTPHGSGTTGTTTTPTTTTTTTPTTTTTAQSGGGLENPDEEDEEGEEEVVVKKQLVTPAKMVVARVETGIAMLGSGDLEIPVQPAFLISGGYPLPAGPATVEVGAGISWTPLPYEAMGSQEQGMMLGVRAMGTGTYPVAPKFSLRGNLGLGMVALSGLSMGNPIAADRSAQSFTLFSVRFGVAADYEITPNIVGTVQPFAIAFSPGADGMYGSSLREINVLFGVGYKQ